MGCHRILSALGGDLPPWVVPATLSCMTSLIGGNSSKSRAPLRFLPARGWQTTCVTVEHTPGAITPLITMDQTLKGHPARGSTFSQTALATLKTPSLSATSSFISIYAASHLVFCLLTFLWSTSDVKPESFEHKLLRRGDLAFIFNSFERVGAMLHRRQEPEGAFYHLLVLQTRS